MKNLNLYFFIAFLAITFLPFFFTGCGSSDNSENEKITAGNELESVENNIDDDISEQANLLYVATLSGINLRSEPSTSGEVVDRIVYGQAVELIRTTGIPFESSGFSGEWTEVKYEDKQGYLFNGFLLPIEAPGFNPPATLSEYFHEQLQPIGREIAQKNIDDTGNDHRDWKVISEDQLEIKGESDFFRTYREYAGGFILYEEIGYEYHAYKGFFPGLNLEQGFLLVRAMYPKFKAYEGCYLELGSMHFPKEGGALKGISMCVFTLEIGENRSGQKFISIGNDEMGYTGLEVKEVKGGIEIKNFYAM